ncbi:GH3 domain-containing protein-like [Acanthaster planci]|uniref:GH3 domain-containing protein-like n=1 Tax=Acanthaster planci TaxID=133434 RepID=A0A8B7ZSP4_ACAPL|nr:GH3 domain-containing protein-like [Acanthaster planci]
MAVTWAHRCSLWALLSVCGTAHVFNAYFLKEATWPCRGAAGIFVALGIVSTVIAFHISTLRCSENHTLKTLLLQYVFLQGASFAAPYIFSKMTKVWKEPRKAQETFLQKLISRDANTEYGKRYLRGIQSLQDFRDKHPLTKYDHYQDYFQRLADGEKNACVATDIHRFGISSGTTGKGKLIPYVFSNSVAMLGLAIFTLVVKSSPVKRVVGLYCRPTPRFSNTGLPIAPATFIPDKLSSRILLSVFQNSPTSTFQISTDFEATYVHLLFGLTDKNIDLFFAPFASQVYRALKMLEEKQDMVLEDLSVGRINPSLNLDEEIRRSLNAALKPNPARANELRAEFARGFEGILGRIWPHLTALMTVDISGYMKKLHAKYTKGTRLFSFAYGCTEGMMAYNLWLDGEPQRYVLLPNEVLTEFIPEEFSDEENPETLLLDEIEVGKRYEVVITSKAGFYRYRMGDVVEVAGSHENCPVIQMKYRTGELFNLRSEKVDRLVVGTAIQETLESWPGVTLVEWTCAESPLIYGDQEDVEYDMFYLLFVELEKEVPLSADQRSLFDKSLRKQHELYDSYRQIGSISQARVMIVRPGSFKKLQDFIIANSTASYNQFKMPKKVRTKAAFDLIMSNVVDNDA